MPSIIVLPDRAPYDLENDPIARLQEAKAVLRERADGQLRLAREIASSVADKKDDLYRANNINIVSAATIVMSVVGTTIVFSIPLIGTVIAIGVVGYTYHRGGKLARDLDAEIQQLLELEQEIMETTRFQTLIAEAIIRRHNEL